MSDVAPPPPPGMEDLVSSPVQSVAGASGGAPPPPPGMTDIVHEELQDQKYGSPAQKIKTALESGASALTFGASKGVERKLGVKPEDIMGREEAHPGYSMAGAIGGLGTGILAAPVMEGLGALGASGLGLGGAEAGLASRAAAGAVKAAIEGGLYQGGNEVGKMLLSDPHQTAQTAALNIGMAGLLGGGLGAVTGGAGALWDATVGKKLGAALDNASSELTGAHTELPPDYSQQVMLEQGVGDLKPNSSSIIDAADRLGIRDKLTPGTLSDDKFSQTTEGNLAERPSVVGVRLGKQRRAFSEGLEKNAEKTLQDATEKTKYQVGQDIKSGVMSKLEQDMAPVETGYKELEPHFKSMELSPEIKQKAAQSILDNPMVSVTPESGLAKQAGKIAEEIQGLKNVNDVKLYRSRINAQLNKAYAASDSETASVLQTAKSALNEIRESTISASENPELIGKIKALDSKYAELKGTLKQMGVETGLGKLNNNRSLLERLSKVSDESLADKFFDTKDVNQLQYLKENFPEQFNLARRFKLKEILDASKSTAQGDNGKFVVGKYLTKLKDVGPEARNLLFDGAHQQTIDDIKLLYRAMPGTPNTSHTSYAQAFAHMFGLEGLAQNATDAVQYALLHAMPHLKEAMNHAGGESVAAKLAALKFASSTERGVSASGFKAMTSYIAQTIKGENALSKATSNLFEAGKAVVPSHLMPEQKDREKLDKKLKDLQANASPLFEINSGVGHYLPDHSSAIAMTAANAVTYLNSIRPKTAKMAPLDSEVKVSKFEEGVYHRALDIAQQPLVIFDHIKNGSLSAQDMATFKQLFPALYDRASMKIHTELMETVNSGKPIPYELKLGLSTFLGEPLDSTMTPQSIIAAQPVPVQAQSQPQMKGTRGHHSMKNIGKLAQGVATPLQSREAAKGAQA